MFPDLTLNRCGKSAEITWGLCLAADQVNSLCLIIGAIGETDDRTKVKHRSEEAIWAKRYLLSSKAIKLRGE